LDNLKGKENRNARFVCAMTLLDENGEILFKTKGICKGKISFEPKGENGFGYDPIFIPEGYDVSMAELSEETKNIISHRGRALIEVLLWLKISKKI
jgi:XTP/dITP diphosphohydrolase